MKNELQICTWNIKFGFRLPIILQTIQYNADFKNLDFFALQEASVHNGIEDAEAIARTLGDDYEYFQVSTHVFLKMLQANALIWNNKRIKITQKESFLLPRAHEAKIPRWEKTFLRVIPKQQRHSLVLEGMFGTRSLRIYVAHLDVLGFTHRRNQLNTIFLDQQLRSPTDITCIAGDFNTFKIRKRPSWNALVEDTKTQGFVDLTSEINWTFSEPRLRMKQKLDAIFLKPNTLSYTSWSLDEPGSDHIPVFANIVLE